MDIIQPADNIFTIYSKSGCINCRKLKELLNTKGVEFIIVDCDEYLLENREEFLEFIKNKTNMDWKTFPIVFHNKNFIGGFTQTQDYLNVLLLDFNNDF